MNSKPSYSISEMVFGELESLQVVPKRLTEITGWHGHIPFAFWLVKKLEPSIFVELGVHKGDSYSAFCQAVRLFSLNTTCYGIDPWRGECCQTGSYDEASCQEFSGYHDDQYADFSRLIRTTFDEAPGYFADRSVDLLHINGGQGYEDVKHNFEFWLPKLSVQAVVLFHDINVRESETGAWKFFHELSRQYLGRTFSFIHSHGLGVLIVGDDVPDMFQHLCSLKDEDVAYVRLAFSTFGRFVQAQATESTLRSKLEELDFTNRQMITNRRKLEIESYQYEIQLAAASLERERQAHSALQERDRQIEELQGINQLLMQSLSMRLTKPLRDLNNLVRRLR